MGSKKKDKKKHKKKDKKSPVKKLISNKKPHPSKDKKKHLTKKEVKKKDKKHSSKKVEKSQPKKRVHKPDPKKISKHPASPKTHKEKELRQHKPISKKHEPLVVKKTYASKNKTDGRSQLKKFESLENKVNEVHKDVLAITNTIPVPVKEELPQSKIVSISSSITNPQKRVDSYSVRVEKEPPGKFEMEFPIHASPEMLYDFISTSNKLSEWFCDNMNIRNGIYTFMWDDQMQQARLLKTVDDQLMRFQWVEKTDGSYFELRIQKDEITNDVSLIITDFAETNAERDSTKMLWKSQIEKLMHVIGSV